MSGYSNTSGTIQHYESAWSKWGKWLLIGLVGLLVICALLLACCCVLFRRRKKSRAAKARHSTEDKQWDQHHRPAPVQEMTPAYGTGNTGRSTAQHIGQKQYDAPRAQPQYATPSNTSRYDAPHTAPVQEMQPAYGPGNTGRSTAQHIGQKQYDAPQTVPQYATGNSTGQSNARMATNQYDTPQTAPQYPTGNSTAHSKARMATNQYDTEGAAGQSHSIYHSNSSTGPPQGILKANARY